MNKRKCAVKAIVSLVLVLSLICLPLSARAAAESIEEMAESLSAIGIIKGTGVDENGKPEYGLRSKSTRLEAIVMLVRLLGKEGEALANPLQHPFNDVPAWGYPYVGYAYSNGLTSGTGNAMFGSTSLIDSKQYITFVLRAMGYSSDSDFKWNEPWVLSSKLGFAKSFNSESTSITKASIVEITYGALFSKVKDTPQCLLETLYKSGSISNAQMEAAGFKRFCNEFYFADEKVEFAVRKSLNKLLAPLTQVDLNSITYIYGADSARTLIGVERLKNLVSLSSYYGQLADLSPLESLTNLRDISLYNDDIVDISPISNLPNLKSLNLRYNPISDISPLEKMTSLQHLYLTNTNITDIGPIVENVKNGGFSQKDATIMILDNNNLDLNDVKVLSDIEYLVSCGIDVSY